MLVKAGEEVGEEGAGKIVDAGIERVLIRSVLTCKSTRGICAKCYGRDLQGEEWFTMVRWLGLSRLSLLESLVLS